MELRGKNCQFYPVSIKSINLDSKSISKKPLGYNSPICSRLISPRKPQFNKNHVSSKDELHPAKTLLPSRGLIKLTALPEELKDPLHVFPATQYLSLNHYEQLNKYPPSSYRKSNHPSSSVYPPNNWKYTGIWVPTSSYSRNREITASDLLNGTENLIRNKSLIDKNDHSRQILLSNPMYDLEREITRSAIVEIRSGFLRSSTHF